MKYFLITALLVSTLVANDTKYDRKNSATIAVQDLLGSHATYTPNCSRPQNNVSFISQMAFERERAAFLNAKNQSPRRLSTTSLPTVSLEQLVILSQSQQSSRTSSTSSVFNN